MQYVTHLYIPKTLINYKINQEWNKKEIKHNERLWNQSIVDNFVIKWPQFGKETNEELEAPSKLRVIVESYMK